MDKRHNIDDIPTLILEDMEDSDNTQINNTTNDVKNDNGHFYQKIATSLDSDTHYTNNASTYFEVLKQNAGIQPNRRNGYYVKKDEKEIQEQNETNHSNSSTQTIDDIFSFNEVKEKNPFFIELEEPLDDEDVEEITEKDLYNDFFVSDEELDKELTYNYTNPSSPYQSPIQSNPTPIKDPIYQTIVKKKEDFIRKEQSIDDERNKKIVLMTCGVITIGLILILLFILLFSSIEKNQTIESSKQETIDNIAKENMPQGTTDVLEDASSHIYFSLVDVSLYSDITLTTISGKIEQYSPVIINETDIINGVALVDGGYISMTTMILYDGTLDTFENEDISFFSNYTSGVTTISPTNETIIGETSTQKEETKADEYVINFNAVGTISLMGDLDKKLEATSNATTSQNNNLTISLYNGEQYGTLKIASADIDAKLYYGASQTNIDLYDVCSSESFGVPGGGTSILIGGHNTNSFANLTSVGIGDIIEITTKYGTFQYEVFYTGIGSVVTKNVLASDYLKSIDTGEEIFVNGTDDEILGLYTCYQNPNDDITPTPYRYAVKAKKVYAQINSDYLR